MFRGIRIPLWVAVALPAGAYIVRSLIRGSFAPDIPEDVIAYGLLAFVIVSVWIARAKAAKAAQEESSDEMHRGYDGSDDEREDY